MLVCKGMSRSGTCDWRVGQKGEFQSGKNEETTFQLLGEYCQAKWLGSDRGRSLTAQTLERFQNLKR